MASEVSQLGRPFEVDRKHYPFADHWFEHDGVRLHYIDHGEGLPVVFFHGSPTWSYLYREVIKASAGVRALAPDMLGFGMSDQPEDFGYRPQEQSRWLGSWLDHLGIAKFVAVVQDWGGPIGLRAILERSDRVAGLVILNTWAWPSNRRIRMLSYLLTSPLGRFMGPESLVRGGVLNQERQKENWLAAYGAPFVGQTRPRGPTVLQRAIRQVDEWLSETESMLHRLDGAPVEMVWGTKDVGLGGEATIERWLRHFPDAKLTRLESASHFLQEDHPGAIAAAVQRVVEAVK